MFLAIIDGFIMFQKPDGIRGSRLWEEYLVYKNILLHQTYKPPKHLPLSDLFTCDISRVSEAITAKRMKIDPYCLRLNCSPWNVLFSDV